MSANCDGCSRQKERTPLGALSVLLLSLNLTCAFAYATCLYVARSLTPYAPQNDSGYYLLRGVVRVGDLLHRTVSSPVSAGAAARHDSVLWRYGLIALTVLFSTWSAALLIHVFLRIWFFKRVRPQALFRYVAGAIALFAAPISCVGVWQITSKWENNYSTVRTPFGLNILLSILCGELIVFFILSFIPSVLSRKHYRWAYAILLLLHFAFWTFILYPTFIFYIGEPTTRVMIHVMMWLIPAASAAFLIYLWPESDAESLPQSVGTWSIIAALFGATILILVWMPSTASHALRPINVRTTLIELSRGPCFGPCPVYKVRIHGNGEVEFEGTRGVKVLGKQTGKITEKEFADLLSLLSRAHFRDLDDRAFSWCFDTPSVEVTVSMDGQTKRVSSDSGCAGAKSGRQNAFVEATDEVEKIVGSDRWILCDGHRCR